MTYPVPANVRDALCELLKDAEAQGRVLDAYAVAGKLIQKVPDCGFPPTVLVDLMLERGGAIEAIEFAPPALELEIIFADGREPVTGENQPAEHPTA